MDPPPNYFAWIASGTVGKLIDYPADTVKVRLQTASLAHLGSSSPSRAAVAEGPLQCLRNTLAREGIRGLYRGCITPCMGAAFEDGISFGVYHAVARAVGSPHRAGAAARPEDLPLRLVFLAGACGGMCTSFISTPLELIKCRLQVDRVNRGASGSGGGCGAAPRYKGPLDCLVSSVRAEGLGVLYRGHAATFLRESLGTACWFTTYETCVRALSPGTQRDAVPTAVVLASGAASGIMLNAVPYPFDTAKSVLQTLAPAALPRGAAAGAAEGGVGGGALGASRPRVGPPRGLVDALRLIIAAEGVAGLYRGLTPALVRAIPTNAVVFFTYETLCRLLPAPAGNNA